MSAETPRRTKIVATLGPASSSPETLLAMAGAGMDAARLNFSHGSHEDHAQQVGRVREIEKEIGRPIALIADLQGPKLPIRSKVKRDPESTRLNSSHVRN